MKRTRSLAAALGTSLALSMSAAPSIAEDSYLDRAGESALVGFDVVVLRPLAALRTGLGLCVAMPFASILDFIVLPASQEPNVFAESWERYVTEPAWYAFERPVGEDLLGR